MSDNTEPTKARAEAYTEILKKHGIERITFFEEFWREKGKEAGFPAKLVTLHLESLHSLRVHLPSIAREAAAFVQEIENAKYRQAIHEFDQELARRERNFGKLMVAAIIEGWRLSKLERKRGQVADIENTLCIDTITRSLAVVQQLSGEQGYLTKAPKIEPNRGFSSSIANDLADSMDKVFRSSRKKIVVMLLKFYSRYVRDKIRRNWLRIFMSIGVFLLMTAYLIEIAHLEILRYGGLVLVGIWLAERAYEWFFEEKWKETHRRAARFGTINLYIQFVDFAIERAFLDVTHTLRDEKHDLTT